VPALSTFFGIQIRMYWEDTDRHKSPHFHARYGEYEAVFALNGKIIEGKFPHKQTAYIRKWVLLYENELVLNWSYAMTGKQTFKIKPLR